MRADLEFITKKFREFNHLMFDGKLPTVPLEISRARTMMGVLRYKVVRKNGEYLAENVAIAISEIFDMEQSQLEDVLIHEMIHLKELTDTGIRKGEVHGPYFRAEMERINRDYSRNITPREKVDSEMSDTDKKEVVNYFYTLQKEDRAYLLKIPATRIFKFLKEKKFIEESYKITGFYASFSPRLNRYPKSVGAKLKLFRITNEDLQKIFAHPSTTKMEYSTDGKQCYPCQWQPGELEYILELGK